MNNDDIMGKTIRLPEPLDLSGIFPTDLSRSLMKTLNPVTIPRREVIGITSSFNRHVRDIQSTLKWRMESVEALRASITATRPAINAIAEMTENHRKMVERVQIGLNFRSTMIGDALSSIQESIDQRSRALGSITLQIPSSFTETMRVLQDRSIFSRLHSLQTSPSISFLSALNTSATSDLPWYHRPDMFVEEASVRPNDEDEGDQNEAASSAQQTQDIIDFIDAIFNRILRVTSAIEIDKLLAIVALALTIYLQEMNTLADLEAETRMAERIIASEERLDQRIDGIAVEAAARDAAIATRLRELASVAEKKAAEKQLYETTFYIVKDRVTVMHCDPANGDPYETWLLPGQIAELIERDGKWIRVVVYDELTDVTHVGWVRKKYLKMHRLSALGP